MEHWRGESSHGGRGRERGGGGGFPSSLLLIFCAPQSASAISIHFLHLSLSLSPSHPSLPSALSSDTLLAHPPPLSHPPSHTLHHFITTPPPRHRSISLSAGLSLPHISPLLYRTASRFPCFPPSHHPCPQFLSASLLQPLC